MQYVMKSQFLFSLFFLVSGFGSAQLMRSEVYDFSVGDYFGLEHKANPVGSSSMMSIRYQMFHILTKQVSATTDSVTYTAQRQTYVPALPDGSGGVTPSSYDMDTISFLHENLNMPFSPNMWDHVFGNVATQFWDSDTNECYLSLDTLIPSPLCISNSGQANHFCMQIATMDSCELEPLISDYYAYSHAGGPYGGKERPGDPMEQSLLLQLFYVVHNNVECGQFPDFFLNVAENQLLNLTVFPNPVQDKLMIQGVNEIRTSILFGSEGKMVSDNLIRNGNELDVSRLKPGVYFLQITDQTGKFGVVRFMK